MEFIVCLLGGISLVVCGIALFLVRPPNWQSDGELSTDHLKAIRWWAALQRYIRWTNNSLLILIGVAITATAFVPHGRVWMLLWSAILVLLLVCILLAMVDAFSSLAGYRRALPEAARRSLGGEHAFANDADSPTE